MSHWDRKRAGEMVRLVREVSIKVTDSSRQERLRAIELQAMDAERRMSTEPQVIFKLLGEVCSVCLGDTSSIGPGRNECTECNRAKIT